MIIMKFGGTSVESAEAIGRMMSIVRERLSKRPVVVVSAFSKVTDSLYGICDFAKEQDFNSARKVLEEIRKRHIDALAALVTQSEFYDASLKINAILDKLENFVKVIFELGELSERSRAVIISRGEVLSSTVICAAMNSCGIKTGFIDAKKMIITDNVYLKASPIMNEIRERVPEQVNAAYVGMDAVITQGFVSSTPDGITTVLGRGGSDYSASLIGMAMDAEEIEIWTDVDGVFTADPRRVPTSKSIKIISFEEAMEMALFGAKVLHPLTIIPALEKDIPVRVLNSKSPNHEGTLIVKDNDLQKGPKALSFKENITVINIFSTKMVDTFGFLEKVFEIFSRHHVSVDLISTSEANVSLTIENGQNIDEVVRELSNFSKITVENDKAQISVIGKNLTHVKGLCTKIFGSLMDYKIYMISQGASAINISFVVGRAYMVEIVNKLHKKLFEDESGN